MATVMVVAGLIGLTVAWRAVRGASRRKPVIAGAALLGALALVALLFDLSQWLMQRDAFERAAETPGVSYAAPGPLLEVLLVPGLIIATAIIAIGLAATSTPEARATRGSTSRGR
ncbi:MAG TPA: hypothetical protein VM253_08740 [Candidatus Limnocylindrales bacterium]|nr:hypothetical protein [Candidatus Limnocylindrales bacterium]